MVGHAVGRDARSRLGAVVAATPVTNAEYLAGKLLGSIALLGVVAGGFLGAAMAMQVLRGEGPLQPWSFLAHYLVLLVPCIVWVCVLALVFECAPGLSGRVGDVAYFFVWAVSLPLAIVGSKQGGAWFGRAFDFTGIGFVVSQVERIAGTQQFTIGYAPGDPTRAPVLFPGLDLGPGALATRALSLLAASRSLRSRSSCSAASTRRDTSAAGAERAGSRGPPGRAAAAALTRPALPAAAAGAGRRARLPRAPAARRRGAGVRGRRARAAGGAVREGLLPVVFAVVSLALADVATRERACGTAALVFATPGRRERFAVWKLGTALGTAWLLAGVPRAASRARRSRARASPPRSACPFSPPPRSRSGSPAGRRRRSSPARSRCATSR